MDITKLSEALRANAKSMELLADAIDHDLALTPVKVESGIDFFGKPVVTFDEVKSKIGWSYYKVTRLVKEGKLKVIPDVKPQQFSANAIYDLALDKSINVDDTPVNVLPLSKTRK